ncbi:hypothetical protein EVAR_89759_1 [Eumeta japonica]|uniref:Uncharacterized protein n=1 Tax=Eumeta variegata TaxID=151549 RepID=A0A4C1XD22_EUMVA|nr:hypothetical protein EVAR_89759_1 [Eumeta japonica]
MSMRVEPPTETGQHYKFLIICSLFAVVKRGLARSGSVQRCSGDYARRARRRSRTIVLGGETGPAPP